jgi:hypothetical protein
MSLFQKGFSAFTCAKRVLKNTFLFEQAEHCDTCLGASDEISRISPMVWDVVAMAERARVQTQQPKICTLR